MKFLAIFLLLLCESFAQVSSSGVSFTSVSFSNPSSFLTGSSGATATQYIMNYTATNTSPCTIEISESNSYSPLVHYVDGSLFAGASSDGQTNNGPRIFVVGRRTTKPGLDARKYSLALAANTTHYYRISNCVGSPLTGSFNTGNIPAGRTFADLVPMSNGGYDFPYTTGVNGETIIDPLTGIKAIRLGSSTDDAHVSDWWSSGSVRISSYLSDSGGYYTAVPTNDGFSRFYWINATTGASAYLGFTKVSILNGDYRSPVSNWDVTDAKSFWTSEADGTNKAHLVRFTYTGSRTNGESAVTLGTSVDYTPTISIPDLIHTFDSTFDVARFGTTASGANGCSLTAVQKLGSSVYGIMQCQRHQQNSPAWVALLNLTSPSVGGISVIAAKPLYALAQCRWCGIHSIYNIGNSKQTYFVFDPFQFPADSSASGPWEITLTAAVTTAGQTAFSVNGEPVASGAGIPPDGFTDLQPMLAGDMFTFEDDGEKVVIGTKTNSTALVMQRGCSAVAGTVSCTGTGSSSHANGAKMWATCIPWGVDTFFNFVDDPTGATSFFDTHVFGGHRVTRDGLKDLMEDINGSLPWKDGTPSNVAATGLIDASPAFAGQVSSAAGNGYVKHPAMESGSFAYDVWDFAFNGSWNGTPNLTIVGGKTHIYDYDMAGISFNFDKLPVFALAGSSLMTDVSGLSSVLPDVAANAWCFAKNTNECFSGSLAGHFYMTFVTTPTFLGCAAGGEHALSGNACAQHTAAYGHAFTQFNLIPGNQTGTGISPNAGVPIYGAKNNRVLARGIIAPYTGMDNYPNGHPLPDNSFAVVPLRLDSSVDSHWLLKIPPVWVDDGIDRSTFINTPIVLSGGATFVKYGYEENGLRTDFYCMQRKEACKVSGTTGTTVQVPSISGRILFTELEGSSVVTVTAIP